MTPQEHAQILAHRAKAAAAAAAAAHLAALAAAEDAAAAPSANRLPSPTIGSRIASLFAHLRTVGSRETKL